MGIKILSKEKKSLRKVRKNKGKLSKLHESGKTVLKSWLEVTVTEGKYREVRRALENCGLVIDRLIRTDFGPYSIGSLHPVSVLKIKRRKKAENLLVPNAQTDDAATLIKNGSSNGVQTLDEEFQTEEDDILLQNLPMSAQTISPEDTAAAIQKESVKHMQRID